MLGSIRSLTSSGGGGSYTPSSVAITGGTIDGVSIGATTRGTGSFTDVTATRTILTPSSTQTLIASTAIVANATNIAVSSASSITLSSNPQITGGTNGQRITITNVGSNAITLVNGNGLIIGQNIPLYGGQTIELLFLTAYSNWIRVNLIPESVALTGASTVPTPSINTNSTQIANTAYVNQSNRPFLNASRASDQTGLTHNAFTKIIYNSESSDTNNIHDATTGITTIPSTAGGFYNITASIVLNSGVSVAALAVFNASTNTEIIRLSTIRGNIDGVFEINGTACALLAGNTQIDIRLYHSNSTSATRSVLISGILTYLSVYRLNNG